MWGFLIAPFVSFLPQRMRQSFPLAVKLHLRSGAASSGFAESLFATGALIYWYSYSVTTWISKGLDSALSGKITSVNDQEIGFAAIIIFVLHPLTWLISYFGMEGIVRFLSATFADSVFGTLPLWLGRKIYLWISGRGQEENLLPAEFTQSNVRSYISNARERVFAKRIPIVPDELFSYSNDSGEFMEIRSSRPKENWTPPRTVRYGEQYFRLEEVTQGSSPRPFRYSLRILSKGVPGRTVLLYIPDEPPITVTR